MTVKLAEDRIHELNSTMTLCPSGPLLLQKNSSDSSFVSISNTRSTKEATRSELIPARRTYCRLPVAGLSSLLSSMQIFFLILSFLQIEVNSVHMVHVSGVGQALVLNC